MKRKTIRIILIAASIAVVIGFAITKSVLGVIAGALLVATNAIDLL